MAYFVSSGTQNLDSFNQSSDKYTTVKLQQQLEATLALGLSAWKSLVSGNMRSLNEFLTTLVSLTLTTARLSSS